MQVGVIGLPGCGKTTVFRALTGLPNGAESGPRARLVHGVVKVPDQRLDILAEMYHPKKLTRAELRFTDVPGPGPSTDGQGPVRSIPARFLADMRPANQLSSDPNTRVLLSPGARSLALYREAAGAVRVDLSSMPGPQPAVAVDTTRAYSEVRLGDLHPKAQTIKLPRVSDWVVAVGRFGQPADRSKQRPKDTGKLSCTDMG